MDPVSNYQLQCQAADAMVQSYYNNVPPFTGQPACIPLVPVDTEGNPLVSTDEAPFKYVELAMPDGSMRLAILTPFEVANGPGQEFRVRPEQP